MGPGISLFNHFLIGWQQNLSFNRLSVICSEENPPIGTKAIEWLLLTTLDLQSDLSKVLDVVKYYQLRWQIELYFQILKSGCRIEKLQYWPLLEQILDVK